MTAAPVFEQRAGRQRRRVEFLEDGIQVAYAAWSHSSEYKVRYEDVLRDPVRFTESREGGDTQEAVAWGLAGFFTFIVAVDWKEESSIGGLVVAGLAALAAVTIRLRRYFPRRELLQLSSSDPVLVLFADRPSPDAVDAFVSQLHARCEQYLRDAYGSTAPHESKASQLERLFHLMQQGAITQQEFDSLKAELVVKAEVQVGTYL